MVFDLFDYSGQHKFDFFGAIYTSCTTRVTFDLQDATLHTPTRRTGPHIPPEEVLYSKAHRGRRHHAHAWQLVRFVMLPASFLSSTLY